MNFHVFAVIVSSIIITITYEVSSLATAYGNSIDEHDEHCRFTVANRGSRRNRKCAFPFKFDGELYDGVCTNAKDPDGEYWCSTRVDPRTHKHVGGRGHWGYCKPGCDSKPKPKPVIPVTLSPRKSSDTTPPPFRPSNISPCTGARYATNYWDQTRSEMKETENLSGDWFHREQMSGKYLPNEYDQTCGKKASFGQIVCPRGQDCSAKQGAYPFIASIGYRRRISGVHVTRYACGGTLINRRYVVTAAHCQGSTRGKQIAEVVLGDYNLSENPDCSDGTDGSCWKPVQRFFVSSDDITVHEKWDPIKVVNEGYDIALIRLPSAAYTINEICETSVQPICLPWGRLPNGRAAKLPKGPKGKEYTVMGWGRTNNDRKDSGDKKEGGAFMNVLQKLSVPHIETGTCKSNPKWRAFSKITSDRQVCAGGELHADSCSGDSGGPLIVQSDEEATMYLRGIVSFGTRKCGKGFPGVYSDIEYYIDWIKSNLKA